MSKGFLHPSAYCTEVLDIASNSEISEKHAQGVPAGGLLSSSSGLRSLGRTRCKRGDSVGPQASVLTDWTTPTGGKTVCSLHAPSSSQACPRPTTGESDGVPGSRLTPLLEGPLQVSMRASVACNTFCSASASQSGCSPAGSPRVCWSETLLLLAISRSPVW